MDIRSMMHYDITKPLSYDKLVNFLDGGRGIGKTMSALIWAINSFLTKGKQFIYVRRYKTEISACAKKFFDDIIYYGYFEGNSFSVNKNIAYINDEIAGYLVPLSTSSTLKSVPFPNVDKIIFDEYQITNGGTYRYLKDEVRVFLEFVETVGRTRDPRIIFLGNSFSDANPYYTYFNILPNPENEYNVYGDILVQKIRDSVSINERSNTRFGKLITGTRYGDYNLNNKNLDDYSGRIGNPPSQAKFCFSFKDEMGTISVWRDYSSGWFYATNAKAFPNSFQSCYTVDRNIVDANYITPLNEPYLITQFRNFYYLNQVYYNSIPVQMRIREIGRGL